MKRLGFWISILMSFAIYGMTIAWWPGNPPSARLCIVIGLITAGLTTVLAPRLCRWIMQGMAFEVVRVVRDHEQAERPPVN